MNRKKAVIEAATTLFAHRGYDRSPMLEIAKQAGVSAGTIVYIFKSKKNLLAALTLDYLEGQYECCLEQFVGDHPTGSVERFAAAFFDFLERNKVAARGYYRNVPSAILGSKSKAGFLVHEAEQRLPVLLEALIVDEALKSPGARPDVRATVRSIMALLHGGAWQCLFRETPCALMSRDLVRIAANAAASPSGAVGDIAAMPDALRAGPGHKENGDAR